MAILLSHHVLFLLGRTAAKIFEIPWVKKVNNATIIATCAFTGYLFLQYLPDYVSGISPLYTFAFVGAVVLAAVISSTDIRYLKILSLTSTWLFFALIVAMWAFEDLDCPDWRQTWPSSEATLVTFTALFSRSRIIMLFTYSGGLLGAS